MIPTKNPVGDFLWGHSPFRYKKSEFPPLPSKGDSETSGLRLPDLAVKPVLVSDTRDHESRSEHRTRGKSGRVWRPLETKTSRARETKSKQERKSRTTAASKSQKSFDYEPEPVRKPRDTAPSVSRKSCDTESTSKRKSPDRASRKSRDAAPNTARISRDTVASASRRSQVTTPSTSRKSGDTTSSVSPKSRNTAPSASRKSRESANSPSKKSRDIAPSVSRKSRDPVRKPRDPAPSVSQKSPARTPSPGRDESLEGLSIQAKKCVPSARRHQSLAARVLADIENAKLKKMMRDLHGRLPDESLHGPGPHPKPMRDSPYAASLDRHNTRETRPPRQPHNLSEAVSLFKQIRGELEATAIGHDTQDGQVLPDQESHSKQLVNEHTKRASTLASEKKRSTERPKPRGQPYDMHARPRYLPPLENKGPASRHEAPKDFPAKKSKLKVRHTKKSLQVQANMKQKKKDDILAEVLVIDHRSSSSMSNTSHSGYTFPKEERFAEKAVPAKTSSLPNGERIAKTKKSVATQEVKPAKPLAAADKKSRATTAKKAPVTAPLRKASAAAAPAKKLAMASTLSAKRSKVVEKPVTPVDRKKEQNSISSARSQKRTSPIAPTPTRSQRDGPGGGKRAPSPASSSSDEEYDHDSFYSDAGSVKSASSPSPARRRTAVVSDRKVIGKAVSTRPKSPLSDTSSRSPSPSSSTSSVSTDSSARCPDRAENRIYSTGSLEPKAKINSSASPVGKNIRAEFLERARPASRTQTYSASRQRSPSRTEDDCRSSSRERARQASRASSRERASHISTAESHTSLGKRSPSNYTADNRASNLGRAGQTSRADESYSSHQQRSTSPVEATCRSSSRERARQASRASSRERARQASRSSSRERARQAPRAESHTSLGKRSPSNYTADNRASNLGRASQISRADENYSSHRQRSTSPVEATYRSSSRERARQASRASSRERARQASRAESHTSLGKRSPSNYTADNRASNLGRASQTSRADESYSSHRQRSTSPVDTTYRSSSRERARQASRASSRERARQAPRAESHTSLGKRSPSNYTADNRASNLGRASQTSRADESYSSHQQRSTSPVEATYRSSSRDRARQASRASSRERARQASRAESHTSLGKRSPSNYTADNRASNLGRASQTSRADESYSSHQQRSTSPVETTCRSSSRERARQASRASSRERARQASRAESHTSLGKRSPSNYTADNRASNLGRASQTSRADESYSSHQQRSTSPVEATYRSSSRERARQASRASSRERARQASRAESHTSLGKRSPSNYTADNRASNLGRASQTSRADESYSSHQQRSASPVEATCRSSSRERARQASRASSRERARQASRAESHTSLGKRSPSNFTADNRASNLGRASQISRADENYSSHQQRSTSPVEATCRSSSRERARQAPRASSCERARQASRASSRERARQASRAESHTSLGKRSPSNYTADNRASNLGRASQTSRADKSYSSHRQRSTSPVDTTYRSSSRERARQASRASSRERAGQTTGTETYSASQKRPTSPAESDCRSSSLERARRFCKSYHDAHKRRRSPSLSRANMDNSHTLQIDESSRSSAKHSEDSGTLAPGLGRSSTVEMCQSPPATTSHKISPAGSKLSLAAESTHPPAESTHPPAETSASSHDYPATVEMCQSPPATTSHKISPAGSKLSLAAESTHPPAETSASSHDYPARSRTATPTDRPSSGQASILSKSPRSSRASSGTSRKKVTFQDDHQTGDNNGTGLSPQQADHTSLYAEPISLCGEPYGIEADKHARPTSATTMSTIEGHVSPSLQGQTSLSMRLASAGSTRTLTPVTPPAQSSRGDKTGSSGMINVSASITSLTGMAASRRVEVPESPREARAKLSARSRRSPC